MIFKRGKINVVCICIAYIVVLYLGRIEGGNDEKKWWGGWRRK